MSTPTSKERFGRLKAHRTSELQARVPYRRNMLLAAMPGVLLALALSPAGAPAALGVALAVAGPVLYHVMLMRKVHGRAQREVMEAWATERRWRYLPAPALPADVAFVRDREKPLAEHGFEGAMCGLQGLIFNFTYSTYETGTRTGPGGRPESYRDETEHHHTILRLDLGELGVRSLQLAPRGLMGDLGENLRSAFGSHRTVELESTRFNDRFTLMADDHADAAAVRRIFDPAMIVRCVEGRYPLATFQYEAGALAFVWGDRFGADRLEEVEHRLADAAPMVEALTAARRRIGG